MIPLLRRLWSAALYDEAMARRWTRAWLMAVAGGGIAFADQIAALVSAPGAVKGIKIAAVVCGFISVAISIGEKNPPPTDEAAK